MAQQLIERTQSCYLLGDASNFTAARIAAFTNESTIPVYLDNTASANVDGIPTVGIVQGLPGTSGAAVYGKLDVISTNWDVLGEPMVDANGNVTYPNMGTVITAGIVTFTGLLKTVGTGAAVGPAAANIGSQISGFSGGTGSPPAPIGSLTALTTRTGTGRIVARDGTAVTSTIWVDLRAR